MRAALFTLAISIAPSLAVAGKKEDDRPVSWFELVISSTEQSAGVPGKAKVARVCQTDPVVCVEALIVRHADGSETILREASNAERRVIQRDVCLVNKDKKARKCVNFDSGEETEEKASTPIDWYVVKRSQRGDAK